MSLFERFTARDRALVAQPIARYLAWAIAAIAFLYYFLLRLAQYYQLDLAAFDFGIFVQVLYKVSYAQDPASSFMGIPHWLGDHFQPIFYVLAPLGRIIPPAWVLLILEPLSLAGGILALCALARRRVASLLFMSSLALAYSFCIGTYSAQLYAFHPSTLVPPLLLWAWWSFSEKRYIQYWIAFGLALLCKENVGFYLGCYGLWIMLTTRGRERWIGLATATLGFGWSLLALNVWIPHFRHASFSNFRFSDQLSNEQGVSSLLTHPSALHDFLFTPVNRVRFVRQLFVSFGVIPPLVALDFLPPYPMLAERILSGNPNHVALIFHYGAPAAAALATMSIWGTSRFQRVTERLGWLKKLSHLVPLLAALCMLIGFTFSLRPRYNDRPYPNPISALRRVWRAQHDPYYLERRSAAAAVPANASVLAQDGYAAALAERNAIYQLTPTSIPDRYDYLVLDRDASAWPMTLEAVASLQEQIRANPTQWEILYQGKTVLVARNRHP